MLLLLFPLSRGERAPPSSTRHAQKAKLPLAACTIVGTGHEAQGMPLQRHALCRMRVLALLGPKRPSIMALNIDAGCGCGVAWMNLLEFLHIDY